MKMKAHDHKHLLLDQELARVVADLTSDGHLQVDGKRYVASFYSKDFKEIKAFQARFHTLFGIKGNIKKDSRPVNNKETVRYQIYLCSKKVCTFLKDVGTPTGDKTNNPFLVPSWIVNGNRELQSSYLRGLFDAEGSIFCGRGQRWQITLKMAKNEDILEKGIDFFEQIRGMLREFGVKTSTVNSYRLNVRKDGSSSVLIRIAIEYPSFRSFLNNVGFDHPKKQEKLLLAVDALQ